MSSPSITHDNEATEQTEEIGGAADSITIRCLDVVDLYRAGNISKGDAIYEFTKTIPDGENESTEPPAKTLKSYVTMLDDWDQERTLSDADEHREGARGELDGSINRGVHGRTGRNDEDEGEDECDEPVKDLLRELIP